MGQSALFLGESRGETFLVGDLDPFFRLSQNFDFAGLAFKVGDLLGEIDAFVIDALLDLGVLAIGTLLGLIVEFLLIDFPAELLSQALDQPRLFLALPFVFSLILFSDDFLGDLEL